jgi:hypothetical protein
VYAEAIRSMCAANLASLELDYEALAEQFPTLALWLLDAPAEMLIIFDEVCVCVCEGGCVCIMYCVCLRVSTVWACGGRGVGGGPNHRTFGAWARVSPYLSGT